MERKPARRSRS
jgi:hypothetical protein